MLKPTKKSRVPAFVNFWPSLACQRQRVGERAAASFSSIACEFSSRSKTLLIAKADYKPPAVAFTMHNPDYAPPNGTSLILGGTGSPPPQHEIRVHFSAQQTASGTHKLSELFAQKIAAKELFYGIEVTAHNYGAKPMLLDYDSFGLMLPLFTSLVWLGEDYAGVGQLENVEAVQLARDLHPHVVVLPHFTCYRTNRARLTQFLNLNFTNVLALRGDQVAPEQEYQHAVELVAAMRSIRGDKISIGVAGYPERHPDAKTLDEDIEFLRQKVNAGADFIVTQICFDAKAVIHFVKACRSKGINVPIVMGVLVPDNMRVLDRILDVAQVRMPAALHSQFKALPDDPMQFQDFAVQWTVRFITEVLDSNVDVYGMQFFTMNRLKPAQRVIAEIFDKNKLNNTIKT